LTAPAVSCAGVPAGEKADGVMDQVRERAFEQARVGEHAWEGFRQVDAYVVVAEAAAAQRGRKDFLAERRDADLEGSGVQAAHVEQVADERVEPVGLLIDRGEELLPRLVCPVDVPWSGLVTVALIAASGVRRSWETAERSAARSSFAAASAPAVPACVSSSPRAIEAASSFANASRTRRPPRPGSVACRRVEFQGDPVSRTRARARECRHCRGGGRFDPESAAPVTIASPLVTIASRFRGLRGSVLRKLLLLGVVLATALAASAAQGITYGTVDTANTYSNVGGLVTTSTGTGERYVYCTGTLISSTVLVTAAHCDIGNDVACVTFDVTLSDRSKLYCGTFIASPYYSQRQNDPNDLAVIVFDKAIRGIAPATVVEEVGYLDDAGLDQSTQFLSVGYGGTEFTNAPGGPTAQYLDTRMFAFGSFNALGPGYIRISQNRATGNAGTCYGDSGGPQFLDGLLVSITVTGDALCKSTNVVQRLDTELAQEFLQQFV
jgi:hypothetical protein